MAKKPAFGGKKSAPFKKGGGKAAAPAPAKKGKVPPQFLKK